MIKLSGRLIAAVALIMSIFSTALYAKQYHVTVNGSANGNGTIEKPWDLQTALRQPASVTPGDTILLHAGTYYGNYTSSLCGSEKAKIVVMAIPGEKVILDGKNSKLGVQEHVLQINGYHSIFKDLEVTTSNNQRVSTQTGSFVTDILQVEGITIAGTQIKVINCIIHNNIGDGIGFWSTADPSESEIYGCLIFHNGYQGPDRGHGHQIYTQNKFGTKYVNDNIIFNGFEQGFQCYTEGGGISGYSIDGNTIFNNGILNKGSMGRNILLGGYKPASRISITNNVLYHASHKYSAKANMQLGFGVKNEDALVDGNHIIGGNAPFYEVKGWNDLTFTNNTVVNLASASSNTVNAELVGDLSDFEWNKNNYFQGTLNGASFTSWQNSSHGFDSNSTYKNSLPTKNEIIVRPNKYQEGRAHVTVLNWEKKNEVELDLSKVLKYNDEYEIYDVQNIFGQPVAKGKWNGGTVRLPMNLTTVTQPNGNVPTSPTHTGIEFGTYLIVSKNSVSTSIDDSKEDVANFKLKSVYPNPTPDVVNVDIECATASDITINVVDLNGRRMHSESFRTQAGENKLKTDVSNIKPGVYIVEIRTEEKVFTSKIIKTNR